MYIYYNHNYRNNEINLFILNIITEKSIKIFIKHNICIQITINRKKPQKKILI